MGNAPSHDLACVSRVLRGDEVAAEALVERLRPLVVAVVRGRLPKRTDEADLIQTVFLKVFTKLEQYSAKVPLEHWVSRIAVNTCLNELRYERHRPEVRRADLSEEQEGILDTLNQADDELSPPRQLAARELVALLLDTLSPRDQQLMTMLYLEGRTLKEAHELTGWSVTALKVRSFRARKNMRNALKRLFRESSG